MIVSNRMARTARHPTPLRLDVTGRPVELRAIDLDTFFHPRTVAVVVASDTPGRPNTAMTRKVRAWAEKAGADPGVAGHVRALLADLGHAAADDIVDDLGIDTGALHEGSQHVAKQVGGMPPGEGAVALSDRGPNGVDDHRLPDLLPDLHHVPPPAGN